MTQNKDLHYISPDQLERELRKLGSAVAVSYDRFELDLPCGISDQDWNHMDKRHRPWVHGTYREALYLCTHPDFQISITKIRFLGIPLLVQVTDYRIKTGLFYQSYSLFNLIQVNTVISNLPGRMLVEQYIASTRLLKPLHGLILRRLQKLNRDQNADDQPIRLRRTELRKQGYRFDDSPDFVSSNASSNRVRFPKLSGRHSVSLEGLSTGVLQSLEVGQIGLLVRLERNGDYSLWPSVCPHEGGPLASGELCQGGEIRCPWHGLKLQAVKLKSDGISAALGPFLVSILPDSKVLWISDRN